MTSPDTISPLLERVRQKGRCPPSLLQWNATSSFDEKVLGIVGTEDISLRSDPQTVEGFESILKVSSKLTLTSLNLYSDFLEYFIADMDRVSYRSKDLGLVKECFIYDVV